MIAEQLAQIRTADVIANVPLCREHFRLTLHVGDFPDARPGQFVHLCPAGDEAIEYRMHELPADEAVWPAVSREWRQRLDEPMLRRAFSIAGLRNGEVDVIYRIVGAATRWMSGLNAGDHVSALGPLGNAFPISTTKRHAWMVAGGVGLPPMLWLAEALHAAGRQAVALCGARSRDLMPLTLTDGQERPSADARTAALCTAEFNAVNTPVIFATDDGSLGLRGYIGAALEAYYEAANIPASDLILYTCGPEIMMRGVARFAAERGIECHACVERAMACGLGTCQSCVVPVRDATDAAGWRYALCCTAGPVFDAREVLWEAS